MKTIRIDEDQLRSILLGHLPDGVHRRRELDELIEEIVDNQCEEDSTETLGPGDMTAAELALHEARGKVYGDATTNHRTVGMMWAAMLEQADWPNKGELGGGIPPTLVALMMVALKLNRLSRSPGHEDSFVDAQLYLKIAKEIHDGAADDS